MCLPIIINYDFFLNFTIYNKKKMKKVLTKESSLKNIIKNKLTSLEFITGSFVFEKSPA